MLKLAEALAQPAGADQGCSPSHRQGGIARTRKRQRRRHSSRLAPKGKFVSNMPPLVQNPRPTPFVA
jgi:hypothetical protein